MYRFEEVKARFPEVKEDELRCFYKMYERLVREECITKKVSFCKRLWEHLNKYEGKSFSSIYKRAGISKQTFCKIKSMKEGDSVPRKKTVLKLIIGLELTLEAAEELLFSAGYSFTKSLRDRCVKEAVSKGEYDLFKIDSKIEANGGELLGSYN